MKALLNKYFTIDEYKDFTYNTKYNTKAGDYVETLTQSIIGERRLHNIIRRLVMETL